MRSIFWILSLCLIALAVGSLFVWLNRSNLLAYYLRKELNVAVEISALNIEKGKTEISQLWLGNPPQSRTDTAFSAQTIEIESTWRELMGHPLIIEEILLADLFVGIEQYSRGQGKDNNWNYILTQRHQKTKTSRDYLIKKLVIRNLSVVLTKADGSVQRFPSIQEMTFYNISNETGFPLREIEKAIFQMMMKELFQRFNLNQWLDTLVPGGSPLKYLPLFK